MKMSRQRTFGQLVIKIPVLQRVNRNPQPVFKLLHIRAAHQKTLVADNFGRGKLCNLVGEPPPAVHLCHKIIARRDVRDGNSEFVRKTDNAHNIIVF